MSDNESKKEEEPKKLTEEQAAALAAEAHVEDTVEMLTRLSKPVGVVVVLVLLGAVGLGVVRGNKASAEVAAGLRLQTADSVTALQEVIDNFPQTGNAVVAQLTQAKQYFQDGLYDEALAGYQAVAATHGGEPFHPPAVLGSLYTLEAKGQLDEALKGFQTFAAANPGHYLELEACRGAQRCLIQLNQWAEARSACEKYIEDNPTHDSVYAVEDQLAYIKNAAK